MERSTDHVMSCHSQSIMEIQRKDKHAGVEVSVIMQETIEWMQLQQKR